MLRQEEMGKLLNQVFNNDAQISMVSNGRLLLVYRMLHVKLFEAEDLKADFYKSFDSGYHFSAFEKYTKMVREIESEQLPMLRKKIEWVKELFIKRGIKVGEILYRDVEKEVRTNRLDKVQLTDSGVLFCMA